MAKKRETLCSMRSAPNQKEETKCHVNFSHKPNPIKSPFWRPDASAQVTVETTAGITTEITGSLEIALDGNWSNNGTLTAGSSTVTLNGKGAQTISNSGGAFNNLTINKSSGDAQAVGNFTVDGTLTLTSGDLDLNGNVITLGTNALLAETAGNTVKGATGHIETTRTLNAPGNDNVAGLGFEITSAANLGSTQIIRAHAAQTGNGNSSIERYFDVTPTNNSGLNATVIYGYDDSELAGQTEANLALYRSTDSGSSWSAEGGTADGSANIVTLSGVAALSRWTAADQSLAFPGVFADAGEDKTICAGDSTQIGGSPTTSGGTAPFAYAWAPATGLSDATIANPQTSPASTTEYIITITDANNKTDMDTVLVTVNQLPIVTFTPITPLETGTLAINLADFVSPAGGTFSGPGINSTLFDPDSAGVGTHTITYTYTNPSGCTDSTGQNIVVTANTQPGNTVSVDPVDETTGQSPVNITFDAVTTAGTTTVDSDTTGPAIPNNFRFGDPATYYDLQTTAVFTGTTDVCFDYTGTTYQNEAALQLLHFENGMWFDVTTSLDTVNNQICGAVTSFSPFIVLEQTLIEVTLDIQPGDSSNSINPSSNGVTPVAILTTPDFDALTVDHTTVSFGKTGTETTESHIKKKTGLATRHEDDIDGDGDIDLLLHFDTQLTGILCGDVKAMLTGKTFNDVDISGTDSIQTTGCSANKATSNDAMLGAEIPDEYTLEQNYPNPFNPSTKISFALPEAATVTLEVYNVLGQKVVTLFSGDLPAGYHNMKWNAIDKFGRRVGSGVYLFRLQAGTFMQVKKMMLMK